MHGHRKLKLTNPMSQPATLVVPLIFVTAMPCTRTFHAALHITAHVYSLMHCTCLISDVNFTPGRQLVVVLPLAEDDSTIREAGYLIE